MPSPVVKGYLGSLPVATYGVTPYEGARDTLQKMHDVILGAKGERSAIVRHFTEWVVRQVEPKDYLGEILAVRNSFLQQSPWLPSAPLFRYTNDPRHVEWVKTPERLVSEIHEHGSALADCDEVTAMAATMFLQLGREPELVALGYNGELTHVGLRVREPKTNQWIWVDTVAGPREREAIERAQQKLFWSLD